MVYSSTISCDAKLDDPYWLKRTQYGGVSFYEQLVDISIVNTLPRLGNFHLNYNDYKSRVTQYGSGSNYDYISVNFKYTSAILANPNNYQIRINYASGYSRTSSLHFVFQASGVNHYQCSIFDIRMGGSPFSSAGIQLGSLHVDDNTYMFAYLQLLIHPNLSDRVLCGKIHRKCCLAFELRLFQHRSNYPVF
jgi:hypothetical protein